MESEENQEIRLLNLLKPIPVPTSRDISMLDQLKALLLVISKTMLFRTMYIIISLCRDFLVLQFIKIIMIFIVILMKNNDFFMRIMG